MNQDRIKDRILRRAARLWGYSELEAETSFDPVVSLLLSSVASELEKVGFELESSRSRIIERLLEIMFPEEVSGVYPSSSLVQLFPVENNVNVSRYTHFKVGQRIHNIFNPTDSGTKVVTFSPTIESKLTIAKVEFIAFGNKMNRVESFFYSDLYSTATKHLPAGELWLGIRNPGSSTLENLSFFVDINNNYQKEFFFYYLQQATIYFGDKELHFSEGYNVSDEAINVENIITKNYSDLEYIYSEVNEYYHSQFIKLNEHIVPQGSSSQNLFTDYFTDNRLSEEDDLVWLKVKFSEVVVNEVLENTSFTLNCVPVVNIKNERIGRRINGRLGIIPIVSEDSFLDLDFVLEDSGRRIDIKNYSNESGSTTAVLRKGGISRFDQRNASELLQYLLELVKDETAAFSGIGGDVVVERLRQINQSVAALHQLTKEKNFTQASNPYLIVNSDDADKDVACEISFWSTLADEGNNIKPATSLTVEGLQTTAMDKTAVMLKSSVGGRKSQSAQDKILELRNSLLTRGRIVTVADIRTFGLNHFKRTVTDIQVRKGTKKEVSLKGGFARTIDVFLYRTTANGESVDEAEWSFLRESFLLKLKKASANIYPYRIFDV